jgi:hypothetical protein
MEKLLSEQGHALRMGKVLVESSKLIVEQNVPRVNAGRHF